MVSESNYAIDGANSRSSIVSGIGSNVISIAVYIFGFGFLLKIFENLCKYLYILIATIIQGNNLQIN